MTWAPLRDMAHVLTNTVIETHRRRLKGRATRITIDLDPTDDPTHGQQELTFFNGHYDTACYLPIVATVTFNDEPAQYAVAAVLRPGNAPATRGARGLLRRLLAKLRAAFRGATYRVRLDGGFAHPKLFQFLEQQQVEYVVAMASNRRLEKRARRLMGKARMQSKATGQTAHLYGETRYAARSWKRKRRVIIKAEVVRHPGRDPKNNPRFVVTNLAGTPEDVYKFYCGRGDVENRLKELHHGLELDRTSCQHFLANQFRVLLTLAAYVLFQDLRRRAAGTACADAQVTTLRERVSSWPCGSSARRGGSCCICRWRSLAPDVAAPGPRRRRHALTASLPTRSRPATGALSVPTWSRPALPRPSTPLHGHKALRGAIRRLVEMSGPRPRATTTRCSAPRSGDCTFMNFPG